MTRPVPPLVALAAALLSGCGIGVVRVQGTVGDGPGDDPPPLGDARVEILDQDAFAFDTTTTNVRGEFQVEAPPGETIYAGITHPDGVVTGFTGASGLQPTLQVEKGSLYGVSAALRDEWLAPFAGCPGLEAEGGVALGVVHVYLPGVEPDDTTIVRTAAVTIHDRDTGDALDLDACYLDPETGLWADDLAVTGDLGRYVIGGVPEGRFVLQVEFEFADDLFDRAYIDVWMPPDGMVPRFPTFVEFPTF